eukprot:139859_1
MSAHSPPPNKKRKLNTNTLSPISRVVHSNDHFEVLELPAPKLDDLNRVIWTVQKNEIKKQYFKISRQVHPDRHICNDEESKRAANSFDIVQRSFKTLHDNITREQYVNEYGKKLKYKISKTKFDMIDNSNNETDNKNNDKSKILSLDEQNKQLKKSQLKRLKRKKLMEKEANEYEQTMLDEFNERRKNIEMKRIRTLQTKQMLKNKRKQNDNDSDSNSSDSDSDIDYTQTLLKLKNKQKKNRRRFR